MPEIRPFRALRYEPEPVGDLATVVAPPYDVIARPSTRFSCCATRATSFAWTCHRTSRVTSRATSTAALPGPLAAWRSDGTFRKDPKPSIYVYEQTYRVPGTDVERTQRGFFARLRLEPFGPTARSCRTSGRSLRPREDRYMLLRATGVNTSPVIGLYEDPDRRSTSLLAQLAEGRPRWTCVTTMASAIGCGSSPRPMPMSRDPAPSRATAGAGASGPITHRRRAPPLRDRPPVPRRAPDDALVRGRSGVRLPVDALRLDRGAADGPADASDRATSPQRRPWPARERRRPVRRHARGREALRPSSSVPHWPPAGAAGSASGRAKAARS